MADLMDGTGLVVAADRRPARMRLLREMVRRCGARNIRLVCHDAAKPLPFGERFDVVLVDAPCSGLGTLRRDPDLKWRRRESDVPRLVQIEHQLLRQAARAVRPGGRLVYATCSSEPDENDHVARGFLDEHEGFRPEPPEESWRSPPLAELMTPEGWLRTLPERHGLDAFFAARFRRAAG
jgi:16S rRNA (cytosine967-C5)-methyltransferase